MRITDYSNKLFLKLQKKQVERFDIKKKSGNLKGYEKYFLNVLRKLQPELSTALKNIDLSTRQNDSNFALSDNVFVMWWQGVNSAPPLVKNNIKRMQNIFGEGNVHVVTSENWEKYCSISNVIIQKFKSGNISIAALSDVIRFSLLKRYGGLWIDSTVILSENFNDYFSKYSNGNFFSISSQNEDYHYISRSRWAVWFIGGKPGYPLFDFVTSFYDTYFEKHEFLIDYYTIDDVIAYFYAKNGKFRQDVKAISNDWKPYLWSSNMDKSYNIKMIDKFKNDYLYGVQKFTYKYDGSIARDSSTLLFTIIENEF